MVTKVSQLENDKHLKGSRDDFVQNFRLDSHILLIQMVHLTLLAIL